VELPADLLAAARASAPLLAAEVEAAAQLLRSLMSRSSKPIRFPDLSATRSTSRHRLQGPVVLRLDSVVVAAVEARMDRLALVEHLLVLADLLEQAAELLLAEMLDGSPSRDGSISEAQADTLLSLTNSTA
jgi:hypothetical protein